MIRSQAEMPERSRLQHALLRIKRTVHGRYRTLRRRVKIARLRLLAHRARRRTRTPREVVFVAELPRHRLLKMARALRAAGWRVVLLHRDAANQGDETSFDEARRFQTPEEALEIGLEYAPVAYHVFVSWRYDVAWLFISCRPGRVVLDTFDVLAGGIRPDFLDKHYPGQLELERKCLENADGLCCRTLGTQYLKRRLGYRFRGRRILFHDYCHADRDPTRRADDGELHVAECGGLYLENHSSISGPCRCTLALARTLTGNGVHFHIHPHHNEWRERAKSGFEEFYQIASASRFMHVHEPVSSDEIIAELSRYDVGLYVVGAQLHYDQEDPENSLTWLHQRNWYDACVPNRIFDYLDAGILTLTHNGRYVSWLCTRYGIGAVARRDLLARPSAWLRSVIGESGERAEKLHLARQKLAIARQIPRLTAFYESL